MLAGKLLHFAHRPDEVRVLGLPRGGVPVAFEVARALGAPLDVFLVCKLGVPGREELAMGAIAGGGVRIVNLDVVVPLGISDEVLDAATASAERELARRERDYRAGRPELDVRDRVVIVIDDGLATGSTMRSAVMALRRLGPRRLVVAVPVAAPLVQSEFQNQNEVDEFVCVLTPRSFQAVGQWYEDFSQVSDAEVRERLERAADNAGL